MERRDFLKLALGFVAGGAALAASAQAAPLMPAPLADGGKLPAGPDAQPAVTSGDEVDRLDARRRALGPSSSGLAPQVLAPPQVQVLGLASSPLAPSSPSLLASPLLVIKAPDRGQGLPVHSLPLFHHSIFGIAPIRQSRSGKKKPRIARGFYLNSRITSRGSVHYATRCRRGTHAGRAAPRRRREPGVPRRPGQGEPRRPCAWAGSRHRVRDTSRGRIRPRRARR